MATAQVPASTSAAEGPVDASTLGVATKSVLSNGAANGSAPAPEHVDGSTTKPSQDTSTPDANDATGDFSGNVDTNNDLPSQATLKAVESTILLDEHGKSRPFKAIYTGANVTRRVLVIFVRHFFCGNCQEYLRTLSEHITVASLLSLPVPTSIAVVGCGVTSLIPDYRERTGCPFPIYTDPTNKLYNDLGMTKTLDPGARPEYQRANNVSLFFRSVWQNLLQVPTGNAFSGGNMKQVGGEFLFEPITDVMQSPIVPSPNGESKEEYFEEEKKVTWCHRMKNTRDHAEIPELREVLGFEDHGKPGKNQKRWSKAIGSRKGTGLSSMPRNSVSQERTVENGVGSSTPTD